MHKSQKEEKKGIRESGTGAVNADEMSHSLR